MKYESKEKLIEPELSYKLVGICFKVHSELGCRYQEKYYQRAVEQELIKQKIQFEKELKVDLLYDNKAIGKYFLDFLVENKIILELKVSKFFHKDDIKQVLGYLRSKNLELGILVNFGKDKLEYKRILNSNIRDNSGTISNN